MKRAILAVALMAMTGAANAGLWCKTATCSALALKLNVYLRPDLPRMAME